MARIVLGTYAFRYPLAGMLSWQLQWAVGFQRLGHDIVLAEKGWYPNACFDPVRSVVSDDCSAGIEVVNDLLARHGLDGRWCYADRAGSYFGMDRETIESFLRSADVFVDLGTHGAWLEEAAAGACVTVLVDGEPGYTQMRRELKKARGERVPQYDHYYTNGAALPTPAYTGPRSGIAWRSVWNPVVVDLFRNGPPPRGAPFTTVMNWQAHEPLVYRGVTWRQKDVEFDKFLDLLRRTTARFDIAVAGNGVPHETLREAGWITRSAIETTLSFDAFLDYITSSAGEFSVCKEAYVALRTGWFSDRSAVYLAAGRPVVMQDTGFGAHLPVGEGLFAVSSVEEAAGAIDAIESDRARHAARARRWRWSTLQRHGSFRVSWQDLGREGWGTSWELSCPSETDHSPPATSDHGPGRIGELGHDRGIPLGARDRRRRIHRQPPRGLAHRRGDQDHRAGRPVHWVGGARAGDGDLGEGRHRRSAHL